MMTPSKFHRGHRWVSPPLNNQHGERAPRLSHASPHTEVGLSPQMVRSILVAVALVACVRAVPTPNDIVLEVERKLPKCNNLFHTSAPDSWWSRPWKGWVCESNFSSNSNPINAALLPTKVLLVHHLQKQDSPKLSEETYYGKFQSLPQQPSWRGVVLELFKLFGLRLNTLS